MAMSRQSTFQDKIGDMTECSICAEIFTNPKILPCVHTFCLRCLETYGKGKQPGDQMACPICRNNFSIPIVGLCDLPNNFFIGKMVEIVKLAVTPVNESTCNICPEGEEAIANKYCIDCEQIICERCSKSHRKIKFSQNHQIVELGNRQIAQEQSFRNSYCEHHPKELVKMYCYNDNVAICLICCVESHQSHRCINVEQAAEEFTKRLKDDLQMVSNRLPECEEAVSELDMYKIEFLEELLKTEESIRVTVSQMKEKIDQHANILINDLKSMRETKFKAVEMTKKEVERFKIMAGSFDRYCKELLSRGSPVDICRTANQMHTRADELDKLPANCSGDCLRCDTIVFHPSDTETILKNCGFSNIVGEITLTESPDQTIKFPSGSAAEKELVPISENIANFKPYELDLIRTEEFKKMLKQKITDIEFEVEETQVILCGTSEVVKTARLFILENVSDVLQDSFQISGLKSKVFVKDEAKIYLTELLRCKGISASWTSNDQIVDVYAFNENALKQSVKILKNEVVEQRLQLSALHQRHIQFPPRKWKEIIASVSKEDKLMEVIVNDSDLIVACMRRSLVPNKIRIETFLNRHFELNLCLRSMSMGPYLLTSV